jgi:16S rRNA (guanine527-N7)-methyltransferase
VKHDELVAELSSYLGLMGLETRREQLEQWARHIELVLEANARVNLTSVRDPSVAVRLHTGDSLSALEDLALALPGDVLDLGSGAGFPGIPLAISSDRRFTLLDSVAKKVRELEGIVTALGLSERVSATAGRAEAFARERSGEFSVVTARAVSELPALLELSSPLLKVDGRLICLKGSPSVEELARAELVSEMVGMHLEYSREFELPEDAGHRTIVCYRKRQASSTALPRREGMAQHYPLA